MAHKAMDGYLNDHLGGATMGVNLAGQIAELVEDTPLAGVMTRLHGEIEEDRATLVDVMERLEVDRNPIKQATGRVAELASRLKFSGATSGDRDYGVFMALESLALGVMGKRSLWTALAQVAGEHAPLAPVDLDGLIARADAQYATLEQERLAAARRALTPGDDD
jgi:hypothetical protein